MSSDSHPNNRLRRVISRLTELHDTSIFFSKKEELKSLEITLNLGGFDPGKENILEKYEKYLEDKKGNRFVNIIKSIRSFFKQTWSEKKQKRINQLDKELKKFEKNFNGRTAKYLNSGEDIFLEKINQALMESGDMNTSDMAIRLATIHITLGNVYSKQSDQEGDRHAQEEYRRAENIKGYGSSNEGSIAEDKEDKNEYSQGNNTLDKMPVTKIELKKPANLQSKVLEAKKKAKKGGEHTTGNISDQRSTKDPKPPGG